MPLFPLPFPPFPSISCIFSKPSSMASPSSNPNPNPSFQPTFHSFPNTPDQNSIPNTTFVQADPSTFRAVVQRLTGAANSAGKTPPGGEMAHRKRPAFNLHERRQTARKLEIKLSNGVAVSASVHSPSSASSAARGHMLMISPVSPLEYTVARGSPTTPEAEERAIAEKGFYLHPSPLSTPRGSDPPELLPLFPLHSPRD